MRPLSGLALAALALAVGTAAAVAAGSAAAVAAPPVPPVAVDSVTVAAPPMSPVVGRRPSVTIAPAEIALGGSLTVTGTAAPGSTRVELQADPYPYRGFRPLARSSATANGGFAFAGVRLDRNTRLRVVLESGAASAAAQAIVDPVVSLGGHSLGRGRTLLTIRVRHLRQRSVRPLAVYWFVAPRGSRRFMLAAVTLARELSPGETFASAVVAPPSRRFYFRVCMNPAWEAAMGPASSHGRCPHGDYTAPSRASAPAGEARGTPRPAYPSAGAIAAAESFLEERAGSNALAVLDSGGRLRGTRLHWHFQTASVVKVMMLIAYLQMLEAHGRSLQPGDTALLYPMIHVSDNEAASAVLARVGAGALERVAREVGMSDYAPGVGWWAFTQTSAADQARLMLALERLIPPRFYPYARGLLGGIEPSQSWGFPPVARPRWQVFFKTGALPSEGLFNEVARLERPGVTFAVAVLTTGDPSMEYGERTIEGVAARLLAQTP